MFPYCREIPNYTTGRADDDNKCHLNKRRMAGGLVKPNAKKKKCKNPIIFAKKHSIIANSNIEQNPKKSKSLISARCN